MNSPTIEPTHYEEVLPNHGGLITSINANDVLSGRGERKYAHRGNIEFRNMIKERLIGINFTYDTNLRKNVAFDVVRSIRTTTDPSGRFLREDPSKGGGWYEIGDTIALKKAMQMMRDIVRVHDAQENQGFYGKPKNDNNNAKNKTFSPPSVAVRKINKKQTVFHSLRNEPSLFYLPIMRNTVNQKEGSSDHFLMQDSLPSPLLEFNSINDASTKSLLTYHSDLSFADKDECQIIVTPELLVQEKGDDKKLESEEPLDHLNRGASLLSKSATLMNDASMISLLTYGDLAFEDKDFPDEGCQFIIQKIRQEISDDKKVEFNLGRGASLLSKSTTLMNDASMKSLLTYGDLAFED